jgi:hypothetical protein
MAGDSDRAGAFIARFPFPAADTGLTPELAQRIRALAEQIDGQRWGQGAGG